MARAYKWRYYTVPSGQTKVFVNGVKGVPSTYDIYMNDFTLKSGLKKVSNTKWVFEVDKSGTVTYALVKKKNPTSGEALIKQGSAKLLISNYSTVAYESQVNVKATNYDDFVLLKATIGSKNEVVYSSNMYNYERLLSKTVPVLSPATIPVNYIVIDRNTKPKLAVRDIPLF